MSKEKEQMGKMHRKLSSCGSSLQLEWVVVGGEPQVNVVPMWRTLKAPRFSYS